MSDHEYIGSICRLCGKDKSHKFNPCARFRFVRPQESQRKLEMGIVGEPPDEPKPLVNQNPTE